MTDYTATQRLRAAPTAEWIGAIRRDFPVETRLDEILSQKLENRRRPVDHCTQFSDVFERLTAYLRHATGQPKLEIDNLKRLSGGASKEQFTFDLTWRQASGEMTTRKLILRMDPSESIVETHRLREAQLLRAMSEQVAVPDVLWVDPTPEHLGHPFLIAGFLEGAVQPEGGKKASGIGIYFEPRLRDGLKDQFIHNLARIHTFDWQSADLSAFDRPEAGTTQANAWALGLWERVWAEDTLEAHPIMACAAKWLREYMPVVERPVIVHGDYRSGNFMFTPDLKINAVLDWELAHLGDHHEDLAWAAMDVVGCPDENGTMMICGLAAKEEFLARYQHYSGLPVDPQRLFYFQVYSYYKLAVICIATNVRAAYGRRTHLDTMMNLVSGIGFLCTAAVQRLLESPEAKKVPRSR